MRSVLFVVPRGVAAFAALSAALLSTACFDAARAQDNTDEALPAIDVISSRIGTRTNSGSSGRVPRSSRAPGAPSTTDGPALTTPSGSGGVAGVGMTGTSTTIITAADIERSSQSTIADILSLEAGIQTSSTSAGVNGAGTLVDMRGFGVTAQSNTLILVNGRRQNDSDSAGFDLSTIAKESIERIEITRGNSGAVLYGDGAIGGVINIVTKSGANRPDFFKADVGLGSFQTKEGNISAAKSWGPWSVAIFGNALRSNGYRVNNALHQRITNGDFRYTTSEGSVYLNAGTDYQKLGLPGPRDILGPGDSFSAPFNQLVNDRRGSYTPFNYSDKQNYKATAGVTRTFAPGIEATIDGGYRVKNLQGGFFSPVGAPYSYNDTTLTTASITPRINIDRTIFNMPMRMVAGIDYFDTDFEARRGWFKGSPPNQDYLLSQSTLAAYGLQTISVLPSTDVSFGGRIQGYDLSARDIYNPAAPVGPLGAGSVGSPLDTSETRKAYHVGVEHRFNNTFAVFGRTAQSFRYPNVDERVGMSPVNTPTNFNLKTQQSHDFEGGVRLRFGTFNFQSSVYRMSLTNELHFNPITFANFNLDPTRRTGVENIAVWQVNESLRLKGSLTYTDAIFREGIFAGHRVPVVSRWTGSASAAWNIIDKRLVFDGTVRYASKRFLDQDEANLGNFLLPSSTVVDVRLGGEFETFFWSLSVQNLFNRSLLDYGLDFSYNDFFTGNRVQSYSLYPLAGRTFMARAGVKFQ